MLLCLIRCRLFVKLFIIREGNELVAEQNVSTRYLWGYQVCGGCVSKKSIFPIDVLEFRAISYGIRSMIAFQFSNSLSRCSGVVSVEIPKY